MSRAELRQALASCVWAQEDARAAGVAAFGIGNLEGVAKYAAQLGSYRAAAYDLAGGIEGAGFPWRTTPSYMAKWYRHRHQVGKRAARALAKWKGGAL